jgi:hypothetical protein
MAQRKANAGEKLTAFRERSPPLVMNEIRDLEICRMSASPIAVRVLP